MHSATKYLGGHSDVVGGALVAADHALGEKLAWHQNALGAVAGPFDAWLVLRGIKTLGVRMDRHCINAPPSCAPCRNTLRLLVFSTRASNPTRVTRSPGSRCAASAAWWSFLLRDGEDAALEVARSFDVFTLAESLGGVESLVEHPGHMTHASVAGSALEVPANLVRLSVGIESEADLVADLQKALSAL